MALLDKQILTFSDMCGHDSPQLSMLFSSKQYLTLLNIFAITPTLTSFYTNFLVYLLLASDLPAPIMYCECHNLQAPSVPEILITYF